MQKIEYTPEQLGQLMDIVEAEGGTHLDDEMCKMRTYRITTGPKPITANLPGCGNRTLFEIPYDVFHPGTNAKSLGTVKVCAICDAMGWMPRYMGAMTA